MAVQMWLVVFWKPLFMPGPKSINPSRCVRHISEVFSCQVRYKSTFCCCWLVFLCNLFSLKSWWRPTHLLSTFLKWVRRPSFGVRSRSLVSMLSSRFVFHPDWWWWCNQWAHLKVNQLYVFGRRRMLMMMMLVCFVVDVFTTTKICLTCNETHRYIRTDSSASEYQVNALKVVFLNSYFSETWSRLSWAHLDLCTCHSIIPILKLFGPLNISFFCVSKVNSFNR